MNRNVFNLILNKAEEMFIFLISKGNVFQKVGPETRKLRGPKVIVLVRGMTKSPRAADLKFARPDVSDTLENKRSIRRSLTVESSHALVRALVLTRLD